MAFLRGINVGGHRSIKMNELKEAFESIGFKNVETVLASGNVFFNASKTNKRILVKRIEEKLKKTFGHEIGVLVRTVKEIQNLVNTNPFKSAKIIPQAKLFVTFLSEKPKLFKVIYESPKKDFKILRVSNSEVLSILSFPSIRAIDSMKILEKNFGRKITTRSWNTLIRILKVKKEKPT